MGLGPGQCLFRDVRDRIVRIQILAASTPELEDAFNTNPADPTQVAPDDDYHSGRPEVAVA